MDLAGITQLAQQKRQEKPKDLTVGQSVKVLQNVQDSLSSGKVITGDDVADWLQLQNIQTREELLKSLENPAVTAAQLIPFLCSITSVFSQLQKANQANLAAKNTKNFQPKAPSSVRQQPPPKPTHIWIPKAPPKLPQQGLQSAAPPTRLNQQGSPTSKQATASADSPSAQKLHSPRTITDNASVTFGDHFPHSATMAPSNQSFTSKNKSSAALGQLHRPSSFTREAKRRVSTSNSPHSVKIHTPKKGGSTPKSARTPASYRKTSSNSGSHAPKSPRTVTQSHSPKAISHTPRFTQKGKERKKVEYPGPITALDLKPYIGKQLEGNPVRSGDSVDLTHFDIADYEGDNGRQLWEAHRRRWLYLVTKGEHILEQRETEEVEYFEAIRQRELEEEERLAAGWSNASKKKQPDIPRPEWLQRKLWVLEDREDKMRTWGRCTMFKVTAGQVESMETDGRSVVKREEQKDRTELKELKLEEWSKIHKRDIERAKRAAQLRKIHALATMVTMGALHHAIASDPLTPEQSRMPFDEDRLHAIQLARANTEDGIGRGSSAATGEGGATEPPSPTTLSLQQLCMDSLNYIHLDTPKPLNAGGSSAAVEMPELNEQDIVRLHEQLYPEEKLEAKLNDEWEKRLARERDLKLREIAKKMERCETEETIARAGIKNQEAQTIGPLLASATHEKEQVLHQIALNEMERQRKEREEARKKALEEQQRRLEEQRQKIEEERMAEETARREREELANPTPTTVSAERPSSSPNDYNVPSVHTSPDEMDDTVVNPNMVTIETNQSLGKGLGLVDHSASMGSLIDFTTAKPPEYLPVLQDPRVKSAIADMGQNGSEEDLPPSDTDDTLWRFRDQTWDVMQSRGHSLTAAIPQGKQKPSNEEMERRAHLRIEAAIRREEEKMERQRREDRQAEFDQRQHHRQQQQQQQQQRDRDREREQESAAAAVTKSTHQHQHRHHTHPAADLPPPPPIPPPHSLYHSPSSKSSNPRRVPSGTSKRDGPGLTLPPVIASKETYHQTHPHPLLHHQPTPPSLPRISSATEHRLSQPQKMYKAPPGRPVHYHYPPQFTAPNHPNMVELLKGGSYMDDLLRE